MALPTPKEIRPCLNKFSPLSLEMCEFSLLNQIFVSLFDVANTFIS